MRGTDCVSHTSSYSTYGTSTHSSTSGCGHHTFLVTVNLLHVSFITGCSHGAHFGLQCLFGLQLFVLQFSPLRASTVDTIETNITLPTRANNNLFILTLLLCLNCLNI